MLHLISQSVLHQAVVERLAAGDDVVLMQGPVWSALKGHAGNTRLLQLFAQDCRVYVLQELLTVNGIEISRLLAGVNVIDYSGLVALTVKNPVIHSWC